MTSSKNGARQWAAASRRRFLVWGAFGAAACCVPGLAGCSGGTKHGPDDSVYAGSYRAAYSIPSVNENGTFSYSVAQKGDIIGSFVDSSNNTTRAFNGHIDNNGSFSGTTQDGINSYPTSGTISKVVSSATGGDFKQTRSGVVLPGSFTFVTTGVTAPTDSPFVGAYSGSFNLSGQNAGPASYSIDKQGGVTGFVTSGKNGTGTLRGQVSNTGAFTGTVAYASNQTATLTGALATSTGGVPAGNIVQTLNGVSTPGSFGAPIPLPANSPYLGSYQGTYGVPDTSEAGDVSFTVDPSGTIAGSFNQNNNTPAGAFAGSIASDGNFNGSITYPNATRTITGKMAIVNGKLQADFQVQDAGGSVAYSGNFDTTPGAAKNVDSVFRGAYANSYKIPGFGIAPNPVINTSSDLSITIDKEGKFVGTLDRFQISGSVTSDGRVTGAISNGGIIYPLVGKISKQLVPNDPADSTKSGAGVAGNVVVSISGADYSGFFQIAGGFTGGN